MVNFGQIVMGPPGAGKSTYCSGMERFLNSIGRKTIIVNLDPQVNPKELSYKPTIDICELVDGINVANEFNLGPNACLFFICTW